MKIIATLEQPIQVRVLKMESVERLLLGISQYGSFKMKIIVCDVPSLKSDESSPSFLLKIPDGQLTIVFRES